MGTTDTQTFDAEAFGRAVGRFAAGVTVVTTRSARLPGDHGEQFLLRLARAAARPRLRARHLVVHPDD